MAAPRRPISVQAASDLIAARKKRPPPPPDTRRNAGPPRGPSERVTAAQLRPGDWLITGEGPLRIWNVEHTATETRLLTNAWWSIPPTTRFVRIHQARTIVMRPDLKENQ